MKGVFKHIFDKNNESSLNTILFIAGIAMIVIAAYLGS